MLSQPQEPIGAEKKLKERNNLDIFG